MAELSIIDRGCRGCTLCVDICPVDVFDFDQERQLATVARQQDCIGCLSCAYVCPSGCVEVTDVEHLRPFHRIEGHVGLVERFLQTPSAAAALGADDLAEAHADVAARLQALADAVQETMGRGHKAVGRRAGAVAATHMPETYEEKSPDGIVQGLEREFGAAFELAGQVEGAEIKLRFSPSAACGMAAGGGAPVAAAVLCEIFHEYLAGMVSEYVGVPHRFELDDRGATCEMTLRPVR